MREHVIRYALATVLIIYAAAAIARISTLAAIILIVVTGVAVAVGHAHRRAPHPPSDFRS